jgi:hypothetical protein
LEPKVFISYSWSSPGHQESIRKYAERLRGDGIDAVLDVWSLKEGHDKYAFMESMVTDPSVSHVLIFCDAEYAAKADARKAGVGTESQIISGEIYSKVAQSKFIPIVCEFNGSGEPLLPVFLRNRIWIDFSSTQAVNENWEKLIRAIYGKPVHEKPELGKAPLYITTDSSSPVNKAELKFHELKQAIVNGKPRLDLYRKDFFDACYEYADALRTRQRSETDVKGEQVLEDCGKLKQIRDQIVDWVLLEAEGVDREKFEETLITVLERLLELKSRPEEVSVWHQSWFEAHSVFVYETFLYVVAALIKVQSFSTLKLILTTNYLLPETMRASSGFGSFTAFHGGSDALQILAPPGKKLLSPAAELIKRQASREELTFPSLMEAELLILMMAAVSKDNWWFPQTLYYWSGSRPAPLFMRATQHRHFQKLAMITGIKSAEELRIAVKDGFKRLDINHWPNFFLVGINFWESMNMDALDSIT